MNAVIRHGRMDSHMEFKLCDDYQFNKIFEYYTESEYHHLIVILSLQKINIHLQKLSMNLFYPT